MSPARPRRRKIIARTCFVCGELKMDAEFTVGNRRCKRCVNTASRRQREARGVRPKYLHRGIILLAATCVYCGQFRQAGDFPLRRAKGVPDTACCNQCRYRKDAPRDQALNSASTGRYYHVRQGPTLPTAKRHGQPWTGAEWEIAARADLTAQEVALMLGRTFNAVRGARDRLKTEPKYAGLP